MKKEPNNNKNFRGYVRYSSMAMQMMFVILAGTFGGLKLDQLLDVTPLFTVIFVTLAVILSIYISIKDFIKPK
jgi:F0F1-type ATP synthase assembly protein I